MKISTVCTIIEITYATLIAVAFVVGCYYAKPSPTTIITLYTLITLTTAYTSNGYWQEYYDDRIQADA